MISKETPFTLFKVTLLFVLNSFRRILCENGGVRRSEGPVVVVGFTEIGKG